MFAKLQPEHDTSDGDHSRIVAGTFFVAGGNATELREPIETVFDLSPFAIRRPVERTALALITFGGDDTPHAVLLEIATQGTTAIPLIRANPSGAATRASRPLAFDGALLDQCLRLRCFVALARRQPERDRSSLAVGAQVEFGRESPATPAERLLVLPPFAPAAC